MSQPLGAFSNGWAIDTAAPVDLSDTDKDVSEAPCELVCYINIPGDLFVLFASSGFIFIITLSEFLQQLS